MASASRQQLSDDPLLKITDVCRLLGKGKTWVYSEVRAGRLPAFKVGGDWRFRASDLSRWLGDRQEVGG